MNNIRLITNNIPRDKNIIIICNNDTYSEVINNIYQIDNIDIINIDTPHRNISKVIDLLIYYGVNPPKDFKYFIEKYLHEVLGLKIYIDSKYTNICN